jgi:CO/xanthine dehydrogenase FAD-binding subunit
MIGQTGLTDARSLARSRVVTPPRVERGKEPLVLGRFDYQRPSTLPEAGRLLAGNDGPAAILAGGTDLLVDIRGRRRDPRILVDIKRIDALRRLDVDSAGALTMGAAVPLNEMIERAAIRQTLPGLVQAAESIATYQLRNRATAVGNLCNASPAADMAPILLALGACLVVWSPRGERTMPVSSLFVGVKKTALAPDEIATELRVPAPAPGLRSRFLKQQRLRGHDLAVSSVGGTYAPTTGLLRLAVGSCAPTPLLLEPIEVGRSSRAAVEEKAVRAVQAAMRPISDTRASADYRRAVLPVLVKRLVADLLAEGGVP